MSSYAECRIMPNEPDKAATAGAVTVGHAA